MEQSEIAYVIIAFLVRIQARELALLLVNVSELVTDEALLFAIITGQCEVARVVQVQIKLRGKIVHHI